MLMCGSVWRDSKIGRCNADDDVDLVVVVVIVTVVVVIAFDCCWRQAI